MIETIGLAASCALFISFIGFVIVEVFLLIDYDPYFWRKMETDAWCAYMAFSWVLAISLIVILFLLP